MFLENTLKYGKQFGWIEVVCGSMFSGKTEELIRRLKRAKFAKLKVAIFKPSIDTRHKKSKIVSHNKNKIKCKTESQGRVHTSIATVAVLPEAEEVDLNIVDSDLKIDVYRSSGPGGQSVNTTDSAVRITHIPTGLVVTSQDEKSQLKNKNQAMRILRARLLKAEQDKAAAERAKDRKEQVGSGERSDKIRTYNYKDNRVSDHRINLTLKKLDQVLDGDLEEFVVGLIADNEAARLANLEE